MRQKSVTPSSPSERLVKNIRRATRSNALTRQTDSMAGLHFAQGQVFDRLRDEHGFTGGYTIVRYCVREQQRRGCEMFVPLHHAPGNAQADFGEATVVIGGVEQKAHYFALDPPHSDAIYIQAYPAAAAEAWVDGYVHAFAFFGRVPQSMLYENDRCVVARILPLGTRRRARHFSGFLALPD